jgi:TPR repeat protein
MKESLRNPLKTLLFLGVFLFFSLNLLSDDKKDFVYDLSLATQGVSVSQYNTGINYSLGRGISAEIQKSVYWYQRASEQGHSKAPFNLAIIYAKGKSVNQDLPAALEYFEISAHRGNLNAKLFLNELYSLNAKNQTEALKTLCCPEPLLHGMVDRSKIYK